MTITLRAFRDGDGPGLLAVHTGAILAIDDTIYPLAERQSWAYGLVADGYARVSRSGETFVVATITDDTIVGFCSWTSTQIAGLYVAPDHQGKGIGRLLLGRGENALRALDVTLSHIHSSLAAVPFYGANGYVVTGTGSHRSRGGLMMADAHLEKQLAKE